MLLFRAHGAVVKSILVISALSLLPCCRSLRMNPFAGPDHVALSLGTSAATLVNHRVRPASSVTGTLDLTLEQCRRFALQNNLEIQAARLEEVSKQSVYNSNRTKILPHFVFSGDLSERSNLRFSYSDVLGQEGVPPRRGQTLDPGLQSYGTGHERSTWVYALETRWSPTDSALAYYVTRSSANDRNKAHHHKVRVGQKLIETVDGAFFRLLGLQECMPLVQRVATLRAGLRGKMSRILELRLAKVEDFHRIDQKAIKADRLLTKLRNDMNAQRNILASAMAVSPDNSPACGFVVAGELVEPKFCPEPHDIEMIAVQRRPEAYEAGLTHLNAANDVKRTMIKFFPRLTGYWKTSRDKDKFLYDPTWKDVGMAIYFDLVDVLGAVDESRAARQIEEKTQREMAAVALGITSQVRVGALKYVDALEELKSSKAVVSSYQRMLAALEARQSVQDLDRIAVEEAQGDLLEAKINRIRALAEANATLAELQSAMGTNYEEPLPGR